MGQKPIIGVRAKGEEIRFFRERKMDLKKRGYPKIETKQLVAQYFEKVKGLIVATCDKPTLIIKVPSGSGSNKLTPEFAKLIAHYTGAAILPDNLIGKLHKSEAKRNLSLEKRNVDPIGYYINARAIKETAKDYSKIYVVDDLIGSGESSIKLVKTLERAGVGITGLLNLVTVEKNYPTPGDFARVHGKLKKYAELVLSDSMKLSTNLKLVFADYTRQKLNRFERPINNDRLALAAFKHLAKAAQIENRFNKQINKNLGL